MHLWFLFLLLSPLALAASSPFVTTDGTSFKVNGSDFRYIGTNAYWLPVLNSDQDVWYTFGNISATGVKVVRLWAFNDVDSIPENGVWFQLVRNGTVSINTGPNGLQKLDTVVQMAQEHGLYLILSLTNNWFPLPNSTSHANGTVSTPNATLQANNSFPRNYLSNDYGGMDLYVRQFGLDTHDQFYTNPSILDAFLNFTTQVVSRYVTSPAILSWELANDPRCNSTVPASPSCTTETITRWHATVAAHIRSIDPNHLISAGTSGFLCDNCPKLYPLSPAPAPAPAPSPAFGQTKRGKVVPVSGKQAFRRRTESKRRRREPAKRTGALQEGGIQIRGRWISTPTRRQDTQAADPIYNGAYGVDSQDISNIPDIGFGAFTLFPDQQSYGADSSGSYSDTVDSGDNWIRTQAQSAAAVGKPSALNAFGLVTQANAGNFVPFNMTTAPYASDNSSTGGVTDLQERDTSATSPNASTYGVTNQQQTDAYAQWLSTGISSGLSGISEYQWGQRNLTVENGTAISQGTTGNSQDPQTTPTSPDSDTTGISPNDGYSSNGNGGIPQDLQTASGNIASDSG